MAGAYLESRELLVLGGQVKVADLARGQVRQRGIQEVAGVDLARPVTVSSKLMDRVIDQKTFAEWSQAGSFGAKGRRLSRSRWIYKVCQLSASIWMRSRRLLLPTSSRRWRWIRWN